jgi:uncharacterized protein YndB with AHSA1/START domain
MTDILHRIIIEASPEALYRALTEQNGLSAWWTKTETTPELGALASFVFGPNDDHKVDMEIMELVTNKKVVWKCVSGPWVDTGEFCFIIESHDRGSVLNFAHRDWAVPDEFYMHCNSKWGFFFTVSLKNYLETGKGNPHPEDPSI